MGETGWRDYGASGIFTSAARFWSLDFLIFYAYYIVCVGLFAFLKFIYSPDTVGNTGQYSAPD
ncbi:hypothetical protein ACLB1N_16320 [Escherichia coli]